MIGHASLREVVGADAFVAHTRADLRSSLRRNGGVLLLLFRLREPRGKHAQRTRLVFILAALVLTLHDRAGRQVRHADSARGLVDLLPARAGGAERIDLQLGGVEVKLGLFQLRQHRHGAGARVDAALRLRFRHALHAVHAAFKPEARKGVHAADDEIDLPDAAELGLAAVDDLNGEALPLGVHFVHPEKIGGKKGAFLAADAAADLHDDVFSVVRILWQQKDFQFLGDAIHSGSRLDERFPREIIHFGVGEELFRTLRLPPEGLVARIGIHQRGKLGLLAAERRGLLRVRPDLALREHILDLGVFPRETFQLFQHLRNPSFPCITNLPHAAANVNAQKNPSPENRRRYIPLFPRGGCVIDGRLRSARRVQLWGRSDAEPNIWPQIGQYMVN